MQSFLLHLFYWQMPEGYMNKVYIEQRQLDGNTRLAEDVARHLYTRQFEGKILVVAERPKVFLSTLKKQWVRVTERVRRERSSVLQDTRARELDRQIYAMNNYIFTLRDPLDHPPAQAYVISPTHLRDTLPYCMTVYVTCPVDTELINQLIESLPTHALVVFYVQ